MSFFDRITTADSDDFLVIEEGSGRPVGDWPHPDVAAEAFDSAFVTQLAIIRDADGDALQHWRIWYREYPDFDERDFAGYDGEWRLALDEWNEHQHPRDKTGQFTSGSGAGAKLPEPPQIKSQSPANAGKQKHLNALHLHASNGEWAKVEAYPTPGTNTYSKMVAKYKETLLAAKPKEEGSSGSYVKTDQKISKAMKKSLNEQGFELAAGGSDKSEIYTNKFNAGLSVEVWDPVDEFGSADWQITNNGETVASGWGSAEFDEELEKAFPSLSQPAAISSSTSNTTLSAPAGFKNHALGQFPSQPYESSILGGPATEMGITKTDKGDVELIVGYGYNSEKWVLTQTESPYGTVAKGEGQESLNAAFEALHPRGPGGKFKKKEDLEAPLKKLGFEPKDVYGEFKYSMPGASSLGSAKSHTGIIPGGASIEFPEGEGQPWVLWTHGQGTKGEGYENLVKEVEEQVAAAKGQQGGAKEFKTKSDLESAGMNVKQPSMSLPAIDTSSMKKVGGQLGSNPGGQYEDASGKKYYVKDAKSEDHARNEYLAASLYSLAGAPVLSYRKAGPSQVATEWEKIEGNPSNWSPEARKAAQRNFAVHAWLANWDATGLQNDNQGVVGGKPTTLDVGGSLEYRAQGTPKGSAFGPIVGEWDTLRDKSKNATAGALFGDMTKEQLFDSAKLVTKVTNDQIIQAVKDAGYEGSKASELAVKLINRRNDVAQRASAAMSAAAPKPNKLLPIAEWHNGMTATTTPKTELGYAETVPVPEGLWDGFMKPLNDATPAPTAKQRSAIQHYVGAGYGPMNKQLRFGDIPEEGSIKDLTDFLDKSSFPQDQMVVRKVSADYANFLRTKKIGQSFVDYSFMSSSPNTHAWSGDVHMYIRVPKGAKAAAVQHISPHKKECEVLIQRGARLKVVQVEAGTGGKYSLVCEMDQSHIHV